MEDRVFKELLGATREALAHYKGEKRDLRTTVLPEPPRPMSRVEVHKLRNRVKVSQSVFAKCLNVSTKLVQAWEGGSRVPDGAALRLLRLAERVPELIFAVGTKGAGPPKTRFEAGGWKVGTAAQFLGLSPEEEATVATRLRRARVMKTRRPRRKASAD